MDPATFDTPGESPQARDAATADFILSQTMLRIKDPAASLPFYTDILGMRLVARFDFPPAQFSLYFVGYERGDLPQDPAELARFTFSRPALLELTHNWGTESDPAFAGYHHGNSEPRGFGHIGVTVPDVEAACARFAALGARFIKRPDEGRMKGIAFLADPDGYWIEILSARPVA
ncbi:MAG TPA: lactoylglutathione lyase [Hyphomonadaceae bacterium]|nr:lactoylglutathione lyase [Hyphomonadaceae bacterium]